MRLELNTTAWLAIDLVSNELSIEIKPKNDVNGLPVRFPICHQLTCDFLSTLRNVSKNPIEDKKLTLLFSFSGSSTIRIERYADSCSMQITLDGMKSGIFVNMSKPRLDFLINFLTNVRT